MNFRLPTTVLSTLLSTSYAVGPQYLETLYDFWGQSFKVDQLLVEEKTEQQHLVFFDNAFYGKVLALDGVIQTTEKDEFVYHEMLAHVPLLSHGSAEKVLIIGGGDGGIIREVLKHKTVKEVTVVEIDESVISFSKKYLPGHSAGAFENPRVKVLIDDGSLFVKNTQEKFDVVICDSTDPIGPAAVLFTEEFYKDCSNLLTEKGVFVNQNGVPFLQKEELSDTFKRRQQAFKQVSVYLGAIPTYVGGFMAFGWASNSRESLDVPLTTLEARLKNIEGDLHYYTPAVHKASFALPKYVEDALSK